MLVTLATPEKLIFSSEAESVVLNAERGQLKILPRHANLISLVHPGSVIVEQTDKGVSEGRFNVGRGVLKVQNDEIAILCDEVKTT